MIELSSVFFLVEARKLNSVDVTITPMCCKSVLSIHLYSNEQTPAPPLSVTAVRSLHARANLQASVYANPF